MAVPAVVVVREVEVKEGVTMRRMAFTAGKNVALFYVLLAFALVLG